MTWKLKRSMINEDLRARRISPLTLYEESLLIRRHELGAEAGAWMIVRRRNERDRLCRPKAEG